MIKLKQDIDALIKLLKDRNVNLTHACQLSDFRSYLKLGGVPSRKLLSDQGLSFTPFESDQTDKDNGVWDKSFCNLQDFGTFFHNSKVGVPTPYGPILISLDPEVLADANDVAICLRSAGSTGFKRESEALSEISSVEKLFKNSKEASYPGNIHSTVKLKSIFRDKEVTSFPEISVSLNKLDFGKTGFKAFFVKSIVVDRIDLQGTDLFNDVKLAANDFDVSLGKIVTSRNSYNQKFYDFLIKEIVNYQRDYTQFKNTFKDNTEFDGNPKKLIEDLATYKTEYMYDRFSRYLIEGTLKEMGVISKKMQQAAPAKVQR